jgi:hypothetical protein
MFTKKTLLLLIALSLVLPLGWKNIRGFSVCCYRAGPYSKALFSEAEVPLSPHAEKALSQSYFYWDKGSQCDVFLSQDGHFVLKIPRPKRFHNPLCFKTAIELLASETALLYAHYGHQERALPQELLLYDGHRRRIKIDLKGHPFVLQKRLGLLKTALQEKGREESKKLLVHFLDLLAIEKKRGQMSTDFAFASNFGVEGESVIRIDIGSYAPLSPSFSWKKNAKPLCRYLKDKDPSLHRFFEEKIEEYERANWGDQE